MEKCLSNGSEWRNVSSMEVNGEGLSNGSDGEMSEQWK